MGQFFYEVRISQLDEFIRSTLDDRVLAYDGFQRANGALGNTDTGQAWTVESGTLTIVNNKASGVDGFATLDLGTADVDISAILDPIGGAGNARLLFRFIDTSNYLYVLFASTAIRINRVDGGVDINLVTKSITVPASGTVRFVASGRNVKVYLDDVLHHDHTLSKANFTKFGGITKHGIFLRSTSLISRIGARSADLGNFAKIARLQSGQASQNVRDVQQLRLLAEQHHLSSYTSVVTDFGLSFPGGGVTQFRGGFNFPSGHFVGVSRDSGFFIVRNPDKSVTTTTFGLTAQQMIDINLSGGALGPDGKGYIPPRDSGQMLILDLNAWLADPINYVAELTDFGIDMDPVEDMWTGGVLHSSGILCFWATSAPDFLFIDVWRKLAWRSNFGLFWQGGKQFAGGSMGIDDFLYLPPYNNHTGVVIVDLWNDRAWFDDYGLDLSGVAQWSGAKTGCDGFIHGCPRQAGGVLRIEPFGGGAELKTYGLSMPATPGVNKWTRILPGGSNGHLICTPGDFTDFLDIDVVAQTAVRTDYGTTLSALVAKYMGGGYTGAQDLLVLPDQATNCVVLTPAAPSLPSELILSPLWNNSP